jgi:hypothetical protein
MTAAAGALLLQHLVWVGYASYHHIGLWFLILKARPCST